MSRLFPTGNFKGRLETLGLPEILEYLRISRRTGLLTLNSGELEKALHFIEGNVVRVHQYYQLTLDGVGSRTGFKAWNQAPCDASSLMR